MRKPTVDPHRNRLSWSAPLVLTIALAAVAFAAELPPFRKGMWEFNRTVEGQSPGGKPVTMTNKRCTDPSADMKSMNESLAKAGCKFSPLTAEGKVYTFTSDCQVQGTSVKSTSAITVESDSSYTVRVSSSGGGLSTKETLVAKRVGDC